MNNYSFISKLLHYFALNFNIIKKAAFDIDCSFNRRNTENIGGQHVFILGLARSGTTILLKALNSTGVFGTLTYRNMPFVTAPLAWKLISSKFYTASLLMDRAHSDRLKIDYDSPEAFEEVFWMAFTDEDFIKDKFIEINSNSKHGEITTNFKDYVNNILASCENSPNRYLSKNNNNILRIKIIKKMFPEAILIVPFRNPVDHANSLLKQHKHFLKIHAEDKFSLKYMTWLGHFEFGGNFKPFNVSETVVYNDPEELLSIDYWLNYWREVYQFILDNHVGDVVLFDYDNFCLEPVKLFNKLSDTLFINPKLFEPFYNQVLSSSTYNVPEINQKLSNYAFSLYKEMKDISIT